MRAAEFFQRCLDAGMPTNMALTAMRAFEAEVEIVIDITLEKRRSKDRERQAKKRERDHVTSRDVTLQPVTHVTSGDKRDAKDAPAPVHTRGENNPSNLDTTGFAVVAAVEARDPGFDWPAGKAADHAKILVRVTASPWLDPAKQQQLVTTTGRLEAWRRDGASWEHDVVPVVTTLARARGSPIRTWKFFDPAVAQSIADNRRALVIPAANGHRHERPDQPSAKLAAKQANMERAAWGAQSAAARRAV